MSIAYGKDSRYRCARAQVQTSASVCQGFGAQRPEQTVEKIFLESLSPLGVKAMIEVAELYAEEVNAQGGNGITAWSERDKMKCLLPT